MAVNPPIGNNFWEGPLGVVNIVYNSIDRGKTTADTELTPTFDIKDIIYQQNGTQYYDKVPTGASWILIATYGVITTTLIADHLDEATKSAGGNSLSVGQSLYFSWRENAKQLEVIRVNSDGNSSVNPLYKMIAPKAYPEVTSGFQWGADTQRNLQISYHIFYDETEQVFFYNGYASSLGITP
jgi:hypothetical protein